MICATTNPEYKNATYSYFADPFTMLGEFCIKDYPYDPGCGCPEGISNINECHFDVTANET
jgi:hypothetical protein